MIPGDTVSLTVGWSTGGGTTAAGPSKALADLKISAALNGVDKASSISPAVTYIGLDQSGTKSLYKLAFTLPSTAGYFLLWADPANGTDVLSPNSFSGEVEGYDLDSLAALSLTSTGQPSILSAADSNLGDIVDGDSYCSATQTLPAAKLSPWSLTDISAGGLALEAAIMDVPGGSSYPITATVVSGPGLTYTISWNTQQHPSLTTQNSKQWYIDVQLIKTGPPKIILTPARFTFTQQWQRDTRTT